VQQIILTYRSAYCGIQAQAVSKRCVVLKCVKDMFYCPWQATATTAMVRSTMWVPTATIGQVP